jgi:Carbohydrate binding domain
MVIRRMRLPLSLASSTVLGILFTVGASCSPRALISVDVAGDAPFQNVTLRLSAGGTSQDFARVSFTADMPFKAGLYVDGGSGTLTVTAKALNGNSCIGIGEGSAMGVSSGSATAPITITVVHSSSCVGAPTGTGGANGGGVGGDNGSGTGGSGSGVGGSASGGVGGSNGGVGGATGTGGQPAGNLIVNGDFSSGEANWGFPAMMGTITHGVTNGALCVMLISPSASVTIGYPPTGTPGFQLTAGSTYQFSYQASVSANNTSFTARVGQTLAPYDAPGSEWMNEPVGATLQTFTHTFTRGSTDNSMGVAFNLLGGPSTVCVDNVTLTPNSARGRGRRRTRSAPP